MRSVYVPFSDTAVVVGRQVVSVSFAWKLSLLDKPKAYLSRLPWMDVRYANEAAFFAKGSSRARQLYVRDACPRTDLLVGQEQRLRVFTADESARIMYDTVDMEVMKEDPLHTPVDSSQLERMLVGHTGAIHALAVSRDGTRVLSCSTDDTARVWPLDKLEVASEQQLQAIYQRMRTPPAYPQHVQVQLLLQQLAASSLDKRKLQEASAAQANAAAAASPQAELVGSAAAPAAASPSTSGSNDHPGSGLRATVARGNAAAAAAKPASSPQLKRAVSSAAVALSPGKARGNSANLKPSSSTGTLRAASAAATAAAAVKTPAKASASPSKRT